MKSKQSKLLSIILTLALVMSMAVGLSACEKEVEVMPEPTPPVVEAVVEPEPESEPEQESSIITLSAEFYPSVTATGKLAGELFRYVLRDGERIIDDAGNATVVSEGVLPGSIRIMRTEPILLLQIPYSEDFDEGLLEGEELKVDHAVINTTILDSEIPETKTDYTGAIIFDISELPEEAKSTVEIPKLPDDAEESSIIVYDGINPELIAKIQEVLGAIWKRNQDLAAEDQIDTFALANFLLDWLQSEGATPDQINQLKVAWNMVPPPPPANSGGNGSGSGNGNSGSGNGNSGGNGSGSGNGNSGGGTVSPPASYPATGSCSFAYGTISVSWNGSCYVGIWQDDGVSDLGAVNAAGNVALAAHVAARDRGQPYSFWIN